MNKERTHIWGAIFDWDGVVINSSSHHEESWERLAREVAKPLPQGHFIRGFGMKNEFIIPELLDWTHDTAEIERISLRKEELYREVVKERGLAPLPGVKEWLQRLKEAGIPRVVGSSTHRLNIETSLEIIQLHEYFDAIVSAEDVTHGKPAPDVFLKAAAKIEREPQYCVVFEDAHVGIQAAHNAGMKAVGVATTHRLSELGKADFAVERLDQLSIEQVDGWFV